VRTYKSSPLLVTTVVLAVLAAFARRCLGFRKERSRDEDEASKSIELLELGGIHDSALLKII
jgi:hypothetical protein